MHIERLKLNCFRNYESLDLIPARGLNVFTGSNAEGKTNAVEAVFLCAFFRSHRTSKDSELIKNGINGAYISVDIKSEIASRRIEIKFSDQERKKLFIDNLQAQRTGELMGVLNVVMFAPEDLFIVKGAPQERRRFIDMEISQMRPAYYYLLQQYNLALRQRNALLKEQSRFTSTELHEQLYVWNERLAIPGASIIKARSDFVERLSEEAARLHTRITDGMERLTVSYKPNVNVSEREAYEAFEDALYVCTDDDIRRGYTTVGVHRDDLVIKINDLDIRAYGSQGQKRTAALSLKLSEISLIHEITGESPVLILDDVLSELDEKRQSMLLKSIGDCQCFLTCTALDGILRDNIANMRVFRCKNGTLTPE